MRVLAHPVAQFVAALVFAFALVASMTSWLGSRAAEREAIADARSVTAALGRGVVQPALTRGLAYGRAGAIDRFDAVIRQRLRLEALRRIKLWSADGRVVYSDEPRLIGQRYPLDRSKRAVLRSGGSDAGISDLDEPENRFEDASRPVVEVYTRVASPEGDPLLFEAYYSLADINERKREITRAFRPVTLGGTAVLTVLAAPLAWWLTRRLRRDAAAREELLRAAAEASDAERRRIARDLHDGVVQDLAGATFALAGASRTGPPDAETLQQVGEAMRGSLRSLRSLLVEIYPPDLHETGLQGALQDLMAPVDAAGITPRLVLDELPELSPGTAALLWRVAQEAVRNAVRHAAASEVRVELTSAGGRVRLVVQDDGVGFDQTAVTDAPGEHFGLRGMRDLIREAGGTLEVLSTPGRGTRVVLEVLP